MAIIVPNAGSTYSSEASVPNSANHWAFIGFQPNAGASGGSMIWFFGTAASAGSPVFPMVVASANGPVLFGPFNSPTGWFAASVTTGCAIILLKSGSGAP